MKKTSYPLLQYLLLEVLQLTRLPAQKVYEVEVEFSEDDVDIYINPFTGEVLYEAH
ncbi:PepSY domain-containing protein [Alkalicoccus saliphilus]|uniref:PepSY domain-containing protein n=1 Tax=Alkalicoccus saliphilus TaxID=200989 RepID=UPI0013597AEC|nr:PepSY domain-containing protein [Alkalicoccus saliphilus]